MLKSIIKYSLAALLCAPLLTFTSCVVPVNGTVATEGSYSADEEEYDSGESVAVVPAGATVVYEGGAPFWVYNGVYYHRGPHGYVREYHHHHHADHGHGHDHHADHHNDHHNDHHTDKHHTDSHHPDNHGKPSHGTTQKKGGTPPKGNAPKGGAPKGGTPPAKKGGTPPKGKKDDKKKP